MKFIKAIFLILLCSCATQRIQRGIAEMENEFQDHIGLVVYDPSTNKNLIDYNGNKYFTPASNIKILTLFTSLKLLGDSIPSLYYEYSEDSLIIWGSGDPSFLYQELPQSSVFEFLFESKKDIYFSDANFSGNAFGDGWAWDDYSYSFSSEKSAFPIYGNTLTFKKVVDDQYPNLIPHYFKSRFYLSDSVVVPFIEREYGSNTYYYNPSKDGTIDKQFPFKSSGLLTAKLLADTLDRPVRLVDKIISKERQTIYHPQPDSIYRVMMQESDNFIAEQLLLTCSGVISDSLSTDRTIEFAQRNYLRQTPDEFIWRDGSGLSRYNLVTPRSMVWLWGELLKEYGQEYLFKLIAVGGASGTIKEYYKASNPYIFGKTGTLSNNHNLSGFLITKKGKLLIFSFMNNNYPTASKPVKSKMEQLLWEVHLNY